MTGLAEILDALAAGVFTAPPGEVSVLSGRVVNRAA